MKIKDVNLETVCGITSSFPDNDGVEFAFIGRSNVGKSSLINSLLGRKSLAKHLLSILFLFFSGTAYKLSYLMIIPSIPLE